MSDKPPEAFVRLAELPSEEFRQGTFYVSRDAAVADPLQLTRLGAVYTEVPPGKTACPFHVHHMEDDLFVILSGRGTYRFGNQRHAVQAGDVLGAPRGGPEYAHQLINTGDEPLCYLAVSSKAPAEVCEYPDSGKFAVSSRLDSGQRRLWFVGRPEDARDYWEDEPEA